MKRQCQLLASLFIFLFISGNSYSANNEISGTVTNGTTNIPFATVRIKATSNYTITDFNGIFTLKNISSSDTLTVTTWDGKDKYGSTDGSGIYIYKMYAGSQTAQGKVVFLR